MWSQGGYSLTTCSRVLGWVGSSHLGYRKEKTSSIYGSKLKLYLVTVLEISCMGDECNGQMDTRVILFWTARSRTAG